MTATHVLERAREKGIRIATAESCTGGMVAVALTDIAGSSDVVERGFVTYSNAAKEEMLGVSRATLERYGAVSEEVAREMADGALARAPVGLAVSITGIAGRSGSLSGRRKTMNSCWRRTGRNSQRPVTGILSVRTNSQPPWAIRLISLSSVRVSASPSFCVTCPLRTCLGAGMNLYSYISFPHPSTG